MTITQTITEVSADLAAAGFSPAEVEAIMAWKPFCPFEGCVCDKYADCDYCEACTGETAEADAAYAEYLAAEVEAALPFGAFLYGAPTEDDRYDW